jgi:glycolate oxidase
MPAPHIQIRVEPDRVVRELRERQYRSLEALLTPAQVRIDRELRETYGRDESPVFPALPAAVVFAESAADVAKVLDFADVERIPVTPRGAGSGKVGGAIPLYGGIVLALERMNRILEIDPDNRLARVQPGVITAALRDEAAKAGLFYPVDPNSLDWCTLGGNVAANAAGPSSMKYGSTREHVLGLEVVLPGGSMLSMGRQTTKCSTGYDLSSLICGSEGTLAVVTGITLKLRARPSAVRTLFATFATPERAVAALTDLYRAGIVPTAAEFFDRAALDGMAGSIHVPPEAGAGLLFELDGSEATVDETLEQFVEVLGDRAKDVALARDEEERRRFWEARKVLSARIKERFARWVSEDVAVPPGRLPRIVDFIQQLRAETGLEIVSYGHAGDGNLHVNFLYQDIAQHPEVEAAVERLFRRVIELGGTLSGEHGIGASKKRFMSIEQSAGLIGLQRRIKATIDPHGILNPGKVFP